MCLLLILAAAGLQAQERPRRIAVLDFEFDAIQKWWEGDWNVGGGISEILVTKLFEDGTYQLVDRNAIDQIMREQDMTQTDRFDAGAAAQLGKLLGADALLIGSITQFGTEKKSTGGIGGLLGKKSGVIGGVGM
jgi:curli biogenesis system outer membrane secretion channel CsgG